MADDLAFFKFFNKEELFYHEDDEEHQPPDDEVPVGSVPEAGQKPHEKDVEYPFFLAASVSAKRNVDIFAEPSAKSDMPAPPEFGSGL